MPEVVAERHDPKKTGWYSESESHRLAGKDPDYVYQRFSLDPRHPQFVGNYTKPHEIGDEAIGFATVSAWEVVKKSDKDTNAAELRKRADDGKDLDTTIQHGGLVLCRLHKSEHAKYAERDRRKDAQRTRLVSSNNKSFGHGSSLAGGIDIGTVEDGAGNADLQDIISRAKGRG